MCPGMLTDGALGKRGPRYNISNHISPLQVCDIIWPVPIEALFASTVFHRFQNMTLSLLTISENRIRLPAQGALNWKKYRNTCVESPISHRLGCLLCSKNSTWACLLGSLGNLQTGLNAQCLGKPQPNFQLFSHLSDGLWNFSLSLH